MRSELIDITDSRWAQLLERVPHDYYHTPDYLGFAAAHEQGEPLGFLAEDERGVLLIPLLARDLPDNLGANDRWRDLTSPYGYASPLYLPKSAGASVGTYLQAFMQVADQHHFVAVFLRLHPLLPLPLDENSQPFCLVRHGSTVTIDLRLDDQAAWRQMRENHRKGIKRLNARGYTVVMDEVAYWDGFVRVYRETMQRVGAAPFYFFSDAYFDDLKQAHGENVHLCTVLSPSLELAAAGVFFTSGQIVEFHLSGTAEQHVRMAPTKLMFEFVRDWARREGYVSLHIGGGVGGACDSLFNFKVGFSKMTHDFYTLRGIVNTERYVEATRLAGGEEEVSMLGYFPAYRVVS